VHICQQGTVLEGALCVFQQMQLADPVYLALVQLGLHPLLLSSQMKDKQVEIQLRRDMETWSVRVEVCRWVAVSVTPGQCRHSLDCIFPILESLSLLCLVIQFQYQPASQPGTN
jgi:hypothetical protein